MTNTFGAITPITTAAQAQRAVFDANRCMRNARRPDVAIEQQFINSEHADNLIAAVKAGGFEVIEEVDTMRDVPCFRLDLGASLPTIETLTAQALAHVEVAKVVWNEARLTHGVDSSEENKAFAVWCALSVAHVELLRAERALADIGQR